MATAETISLHGEKSNGYFEITNDDNWLLAPVVQEGLVKVYDIEERKYLNTADVLSLISSCRIDPKITFSPMNLRSYDKERHIPLQEAFQLINNQNDNHISAERLQSAIDDKEVRVYELKGQQYLDRLDIGRVYHKPIEKKEGLTIERYFSREGEDPFESVEYGRRDLSIKDSKGKKLATFKEGDVNGISKAIAGILI